MTQTPTIYGGASPVVSDINFTPESHQIYGGADPLQNTQTIPKIVTPTEQAMQQPVVPTAPVAPITQPSPVNYPQQ